MRMRMWRREVRRAMVGAAVAVMLTMASGATARAGDTPWKSAGLGVGAILSNVVYMPVKIVYAAIGSVTGGLAYALTGGSYETAQNVWVASLGGTYVIVPDMLTGETPVEFSGTPKSTSVAIVEESAPMNAKPPTNTLGYAVDRDS
jgi:hypothetical protein